MSYNLPAVNPNLTKTELKSIADDTIQILLDNGNFIQSAELFSKVEFLIKEVKSKSEWVNGVRDEVERFGKGFATSSGTKIELAEVGTKYDFSLCNDNGLIQLEAELEMIERKLKDRKEFLKTIPLSGMELLIGDEIVKVYPPSKTSTSSIKCTIAK